MKAEILQGNVFDLLPTLEPGSVDAVVTSPPYWSLRDYSTCRCVVGGKKRPGCTNCDDNGKVPVVRDHQLGMEKTPGEYVANMVRVFGLVREVMAPHATCWINCGDTYSSDWPCQRRNVIGEGSLEDGTRKNRPSRSAGLADGNLCLIPQRLALALQADGWIVRSVVVWHKPAPMPSSVSGWAWRRCRVKVASKILGTNKKSHNGNRSATGGIWEGGTQWQDCPGCDRCEPNGGYVLRKGSWRPTSSWEPVLMLAKSEKYFCDGEAVKQPAAAATVSRDKYTRVAADGTKSSEADANGVLGRPTLGLGGEHRGPQYAVAHDHETICDGANLRNVWTIAAEPLSERHYAAFPSELVHRCLKAATSAKGYCAAKVKKLKVKDNLTPEQKERVAKFLRKKGLI